MLTEPLIQQDWVDVFSLMGESTVVLHMPSTDADGVPLSGSDVDCAVIGYDRLWPLRLKSDWRLYQCMHYDLCAWYCVLENHQGLVAFDLLVDPNGLGRDGLPTSMLRGVRSVIPTPAIRAAYLAAKRIRKGIAGDAEWQRIGELAREDAAAFSTALTNVIGPKVSRSVMPFALKGQAPPPPLQRQAHLAQLVRRVGTPTRFVNAMVLGARREVERVNYPTGLFVLLVGPDGSGKSSLSACLPAECAGAFRRDASFHWRPGLLPRPGAFLSRTKSDPSRPHDRPPYSRGASLLLLSYYWVDFLAGSWLRVLPVHARSGLVIMERGWWDMAVDSHRYRLDVSPWMVRVLGRALPRPDLTFVLEASPSVLVDRKGELGQNELARQGSAWRRPQLGRSPVTYLDAGRPLEEVRMAARREIMKTLEERTASRIGSGWLTLPRGGSPRWFLPRGPRSTAIAALRVHQPMTPIGLVSWKAARLTARCGGFRLLPRGSAPPQAVRQILAPHLPPHCTVAVVRANHPGRYTVMLVDDQGGCYGVAKVAMDASGREALDREAAGIERYGPLLESPLSAPNVRVHESGLLLMDEVNGRTRLRPWRLAEDVAWAIGRFSRASIRSKRSDGGLAHGDCAPWNLLPGDDGWVLIDWEECMTGAHPFTDLCHYLVQAYALLGHPSHNELVAGFAQGRGWVGRAVAAYADGADSPAYEATKYLGTYLRWSGERLRAEDNDVHTYGAARHRLLRSVEDQLS